MYLRSPILWVIPYYESSRSSRPEVFCRKGVLRNFAKFTGKNLCQGLFFNNVAGLTLASDENIQYLHKLFVYLKSPILWLIPYYESSRSSRPEVFCRKGVLRNFAKFTGKNLCEGLFSNNVAGLTLATLLKKGLWHRCFPVKFLRTPFFNRTPPVAASYHCFHVQSTTCLITLAPD